MKEPSAIINLEKGKIPPQAVDLEEVVLGAVMADEKGLDLVIDFLRPEHFYKDAHMKIYQAALDLFHLKEPIDLLTVSHKLKEKKELEMVGGDFYLIGLTQKVAGSAHIEYHSRIIVQKYLARMIIKVGSEAMNEGYDDSIDVFDIIDSIYSQMNQISDDLFQGKEVPVQEVVDEVIVNALKIYEGEIKPGIDTPIDKLTERMGGWRNGELIILAARPGMGKTAFALASAIHPAKLGIPVGIFSLEMDRKVLTSRILSIEAEVDGSKFITKGLDPQDLKKVNKVRGLVMDLPIFIEDSNISTIDKLRLKAKKMKANHKIQILILDYLQLMSGSEKSREQEISKISRGLKLLAGELQIPIIALSQLSRSVENRSTKRPQLSDLRESGAIEQDADVVMFLYRPEYYNQDTWDDYGQASCTDEAEYIVAKNRNGGLARNRMSFTAEFTKFENLKDKVDPFRESYDGLTDDQPF